MAIRSGNLKMVANTKKSSKNPELFNIDKDIAEKSNLSEDQTKTRDEMLKKWQEWNSQLKDRVFPTLQEVWWK